MLAQRRQAVPHVAGKIEPITRDRACTALPREATESRITEHMGGFKIKQGVVVLFFLNSFKADVN